MLAWKRPTHPAYRSKAHHSFSLARTEDIIKTLEADNERKARTIDQLLDENRRHAIEYQQNLDNCTEATQNASEEDAEMKKRRRVLVGYDDRGKAVYRQINGKSQDERNDNTVRAYIESGRIWEFLNLAGQPVFTPPPKPTHPFEDAIWKWYADFKEPSIAATYKRTLTGNIKCLCSFFSSKAVEDIAVEDVQAFMNSQSNLNKDTVNARKTTLGDFLDYAVEKDWINKNPTRSKVLKNPGRDAEETNAYTKDEIRQIIESVSNMTSAVMQMYVGLLLFQGMRREEALGLKWEDIDFETGFLHIKRAVTMPENSPIVKETKTKKSKRPMPIADTLLPILLKHRKESGHVITDRDGQLFTKARWKYFARNVEAALGVGKLDARKFRRTFATMNIAAGMDIKTVAALMGHSKISTTADVYAKVEQGKLEQARSAMTDYINQ